MWCIHLRQELRSERDSFTTRCYMIVQKSSYGVRRYDRVLLCLQTNAKFPYIAFAYFVYICSIWYASICQMPRAQFTATNSGWRLKSHNDPTDWWARWNQGSSSSNASGELSISCGRQRPQQLHRSMRYTPQGFRQQKLSWKEGGSCRTLGLIVRGLEETESYHFVNVAYYMNYLSSLVI